MEAQTPGNRQPITLLDVPWKAVPASGVEMKLTQTNALQIDFDFHGHAGYAIARRDGKITLPQNFELSFRIQGDAPRNSVEVKFIQGDNVWWSVRREYEFPKEWRRVSVKKRQLEFAWGPAGAGPLPKTVDAIEIVITAGTGGKGTVLLDQIEIAPLDTPPSKPPRIDEIPYVNRGPVVLDLGARYEIGGFVVDWAKKPQEFRLATSLDQKQWEVQVLERGTWLYVPDTDARYVQLFTDAGSVRSIRVLPPMRDENAFFSEMASHFRRGLFPRYLLGEQSYWTILGGTDGEEEEALISEDGAIEAGEARFSIEPFLLLDGKVVTWNDVTVEQREGPQVVWQKHLTITPRYENGTLKVRYETAPNAKLLLAVRPFQVNTQWQFLNRTGGVVKVTDIVRGNSTLTVTADSTKTLRVPGGTATRENWLPEAGVPGPYRSMLLQFDRNDVTIEIPLAGTTRVGSSGDPSTALGMTRAFSLDLPAEPRIAKTIDAQLRAILINRDGAAIHPGSRSYGRSWIRDGSLTSEALLRLGKYEVVREYIEWYAKAIREDGYVPCCVSSAGPDPVPEHDSHGQFLYLVAEYYRHTGDRALVERMAPTIQRVVTFIDKLRHERMTKQYEGTVFYGLVPESISHEGYSAKPMHSYWDDLFILKGLNDASFLAGVLGHDAERDADAQLAAAFQKDLLASIDRAMRDHKIDYIPGSAELGDFDATSTTVGVTPVGADLPPAALQRTFEKYWQHALEPRTYTPYEWRVVGTLVRLGQAERARQLLQYFFADQRPAAWYQWAEVVRANPREGGFLGDMPHTWVGSDFIRSALDLFAYDAGDQLVLAAGVSPEWARAGVRVQGLSTHFGILDYSLDAQHLRIGGTLRIPERGIVVKSPYGGPDVVVRSVPADIVLKEGS